MLLKLEKESQEDQGLEKAVLLLEDTKVLNQGQVGKAKEASKVGKCLYKCVYLSVDLKIQIG